MFCLGFYFDINEFNGVFEVYLFLKRGSYLIWAELGFYCFGFAQSLISSLLFFFVKFWNLRIEAEVEFGTVDGFCDEGAKVFIVFAHHIESVEL